MRLQNLTFCILTILVQSTILGCSNQKICSPTGRIEQKSKSVTGSNADQVSANSHAQAKHARPRKRSFAGISDVELCRRIKRAFPSGQPETIERLVGIGSGVSSIQDSDDYINLFKGWNKRRFGPWGGEDNLFESKHIVGWYSEQVKGVVYGVYWDNTGAKHLFSVEILRY